MANFVSIYLVAVVTFFAFFFSVPYWTGSEMQDVSKNGVYRWLYYKCSSLGNLMYRGIETVNNKIDRAAKLKPGGTAHTCVNLLFYVVAVFAMNTLYDSLMSSFVSGEFDELKVDLSSSYSRFQEVMLVWGIMNNFHEVTGVGSFFAALRQSIGGITAFVIGTMIFFSVMYGLLEQKVIELKLAERIRWQSKLEDENHDGVADFSVKNLWLSVTGNAQEFLDKIAVLRNFKVVGVVIAFLGVTAVYSLVMAVCGEVADFQGLLLDLLDESDIMNSIGSFVIGFIYAKVVVVLGRAVYRVMPSQVRSAIDSASRKGNDAVAAIKEKRNLWSAKMDSLYQRTTKDYTLHRLHLD